MSHVSDLRLEDLPDVEPYLINKLKRAGIQSVLDLAVSIPHELAEGEGGGNYIDDDNNNSIIFIDTENTFRPERIHQIAEGRGLEPEEIMKKVFVCKIYNSAHLEAIIKNLGKSIEHYKAKLVIIDSIISLHRAEFPGRETL
ncbi:MAG TPA: hypothetical protein VE076_03805, partial [Nitrososphaeraceae archaeon]|nr:hypothetical protein [Nitrososphaeraceae archaeon]